MFKEITRFEVIKAGGMFLKIDWSEFDGASTSHHRYSIGSEALPLRDKWFKYFLNMIKENPDWLKAYKDFHMFAKINAHGKHEAKFNKHLDYIEKEAITMKEVKYTLKGGII